MQVTNRHLLERRFLVVASDGRHVTVGRHVHPDEIALIESAGRLDAEGLTGWLAYAEGDYHDPRGNLAMIPVRRITAQEGAWDLAEEAFHARRAAALE